MLLDVFTPHMLSYLPWREVGQLVARVTRMWHDVVPLDRRLNSVVWHTLCCAIVRELPFLRMPIRLPFGNISSWEAFFWEQCYPASPAALSAAAASLARAIDGALRCGAKPFAAFAAGERGDSGR